MQLLVNGGVVAARFPGVSHERTRSASVSSRRRTCRCPGPTGKLPPPDAGVEAPAAADRLCYLLRGDDDGRFGPATQNAILAFQKWERLPRTD